MVYHWGNEEQFLLVYYYSLSLSPTTITELLAEFSPTDVKNKRAVTNKMGNIQRQLKRHGRKAFFDDETKTWDKQAIRRWMEKKVTDNGRAKRLMRIQDTQWAIIDKWQPVGRQAAESALREIEMDQPPSAQPPTQGEERKALRASPGQSESSVYGHGSGHGNRVLGHGRDSGGYESSTSGYRNNATAFDRLTPDCRRSNWGYDIGASELDSSNPGHRSNAPGSEVGAPEFDSLNLGHRSNAPDYKIGASEFKSLNPGHGTNTRGYDIGAPELAKLTSGHAMDAIGHNFSSSNLDSSTPGLGTNALGDDSNANPQGRSAFEYQRRPTRYQSSNTEYQGSYPGYHQKDVLTAGGSSATYGRSTAPTKSSVSNYNDHSKARRGQGSGRGSGRKDDGAHLLESSRVYKSLRPSRH